jgi:hypothetical protein
MVNSTKIIKKTHTHIFGVCQVIAIMISMRIDGSASIKKPPILKKIFPSIEKMPAEKDITYKAKAIARILGIKIN